MHRLRRADATADRTRFDEADGLLASAFDGKQAAIRSHHEKRAAEAFGVLEDFLVAPLQDVSTFYTGHLPISFFVFSLALLLLETHR